MAAEADETENYVYAIALQIEARQNDRHPVWFSACPLLDSNSRLPVMLRRDLPTEKGMCE